MGNSAVKQDAHFNPDTQPSRAAKPSPLQGLGWEWVDCSHHEPIPQLGRR
jgi:hypothetical protein